MKLIQVSERVWVLPFEEERDRPNLGYVRGDHWSLAIDAGHSDDHVALFYRALEDAGLPLPRLTALTHWHWDHTFGMHAIHGLSVANARTDAHLREFRKRLEREGRGMFLALHESVGREYAGDKPVVVTPPDMVFSGEMALDLGGCHAMLFEAPSPHTDDATLVYVVNENVLFLGDACCGAFPDWGKDEALAKKLAKTIESIGASTCLEGHWTPVSTEDTIRDLLAPEG